MIFILILISIYLIVINYNDVISEDENILQLFKQNENIIKKYCFSYKVEPRIYIAVVYGELINNFNQFDRFDNLRSELGLDPSIGFAQIKISTAIWLEKKLQLLAKNNSQ